LNNHHFNDEGQYTSDECRAVLVHDDQISRLPSAAEPKQVNSRTTIPYQLDLIDSSNTFSDDPLLHADILTNCNDYFTSTNKNDIDDKCLYQIYDCSDELITVPSDDDHHYDTHDFASSIHSVCLPDFIDSTDPTSLSGDAANRIIINALSALDKQLVQLGITWSEFYVAMCTNDNPDTMIVHAHFDGRSMASTTDQLQCLWYYRQFTATKQPQTLQVADRHQHQPEGIGFLCVPIKLRDTTAAICFVRCLYTPTLSATIISPHNVSTQYNCIRYSCASNFDGTNCTICLQNNSENDIRFPQSLHRGLLFSEPLVITQKTLETTILSPISSTNMVGRPRLGTP
jgi:hypothetical protein